MPYSQTVETSEDEIFGNKVELNDKLLELFKICPVGYASSADHIVIGASYKLRFLAYKVVLERRARKDNKTFIYSSECHYADVKIVHTGAKVFIYIGTDVIPLDKGPK